MIAKGQRKLTGGGAAVDCDVRGCIARPCIVKRGRLSQIVDIGSQILRQSHSTHSLHIFNKPGK